MKLRAGFGCLSLCLTPIAATAQELCTALTDTALYEDAQLTQDIRPIFQFDGAQFIPEAKENDVMYGQAYDVLMQPMLESGSYTRSSDWQCEVLATQSMDTGTKVYDVSAEACQREMSDTRLSISPSSFGFYEASCDVLSQETGAPGETLVSLGCYGEGNEWTVEGSYQEHDDGSISLTFDGRTETYVACQTVGD
jgi:hypothetical protein